MLFIEPRGAVERYEMSRDRMPTVLRERGGRLCAQKVPRLLAPPLGILRYGGRLCTKRRSCFWCSGEGCVVFCIERGRRVL